MSRNQTIKNKQIWLPESNPDPLGQGAVPIALESKRMQPQDNGCYFEQMTL